MKGRCECVYEYITELALMPLKKRERKPLWFGFIVPLKLDLRDSFSIDIQNYSK